MIKNNNVENVVIIGGGPAGLTAALYTSRAQLSPILIEGPEPGGQLTTTTEVENFPGFSDGILGPDLINNIHKQAEKFGTRYKSGVVTKVEKQDNLITINVDNEIIKTRSIIISTGASAKLLGLESEKLLMGRGLSTCATCDGFFYRDQEIAVIGGGDSACEEAFFLTRFASKVYLIHRRDSFKASKAMQEKVFQNDKIEIVYNSIVEDFLGTDKLESIKIKNVLDDSTSELTVSGAFVAIGHTPNTELIKDLVECDENGYIITNSPSSKTNSEGIFACGDVQDTTYKQAITAAGSGCVAALDAEHYLSNIANTNTNKEKNE